jgi:hypothetical protein
MAHLIGLWQNMVAPGMMLHLLMDSAPQEQPNDASLVQQVYLLACTWHHLA